jgi:hypothetical protein
MPSGEPANSLDEPLVSRLRRPSTHRIEGIKNEICRTVARKLAQDVNEGVLKTDFSTKSVQ